MTNGALRRAVRRAAARAGERASPGARWTWPRSIQEVTEEIVLRMARHAASITGQRDACLAGGVALNCVANGRLLREGPFERIWIQPAAGDAGGALGAALHGWHQIAGQPARRRRRERRHERRLPRARLLRRGDRALPAMPTATRPSDRGRAATLGRADRRAGGRRKGRRPVRRAGWSSGRGRSATARSSATPARRRCSRSMNLKIKYRESFRPFAPAVLAERASEYFDIDVESPYMMLVADVARAALRRPRTASTQADDLRDVGQRGRARRSRPSPTSTTRRACRRSTASRAPSSTRSSARSTS